MRWIVAVVGTAAVGCSEYDLGSKPDPVVGTSTPTTPPDTTPTLGADCDPLDDAPSEASIDETCLIDPPVGSFTPVLEWADETLGPAYTTPVVGQLTDDDGDGDVDLNDVPDIVAASVSGTLIAVSGDGSGPHWSVNGLGSEPSTAAIGDLDGDGRPDVAVGGSGFVAAFRGDTGAPMWRLDDPSIALYAVCGGVGIYDLAADGTPDVVLGRLIIDGATGVVQGVGAYGMGTGNPPYASFGVAADIDADGDLEVVVGDALYDANGTTVWYNGQPDGFVAVANFDADPEGEIVVSWYPGTVRLQDSDGTVIWQTPSRLIGPTVGPPTVADFDGDGAPEIGVAGNNVYVVLETDGTVKWQAAVQDFSSGFTGSSVFDFEGDGQAEVVYADEQDVWVFDGTTGAVKLQNPAHSSATCSEYPTIADVDNDGHAEIVYTSSGYAGPEVGIRVIGDANDSWMAGRPVWNQHAYAITNVDNDGGIPANPAPNWPTYNNFRSGDVTAVAGNGQADAIPLDGDACSVDCDEGHLYVVVRVGNGGTDDLPPGVPATLYTETGSGWVPVETRTTPDVLVPGATTDGWTYDLDPSAIGALRFAVDDDGTGLGLVAECHEDNNVLDLTAGCP
ncbi:MAG: VCBS repeat-containing protein [Myxococcota bacterium]